MSVKKSISIPTVTEHWICKICLHKLSSKSKYCSRCGHFKDNFRRHWQYEELSQLYESFLEGVLKFEDLKERIKDLGLKGHSKLKDSLEDFISYENKIRPEDIETYNYVLNSLKGNYSFNSLIYIKDQSLFNLSRGIVSEQPGIGSFRASLKTIDHITFIIESPLDECHEGVQIAFADEEDFFFAVKVFLEYYGIDLSEVWITESFSEKAWPYPLYELWREDDNANRYMMEQFYIKNAAQKKCDEFLARAHKQDYWVKELSRSEGSAIHCLNHKIET